MLINIVNIVLILSIILLGYIYYSKYIEKFTVNVSAEDYYPIDYTKTIANDYVDNSFKSKNMAKLEELLFQVKKIANQDVLSPFIFNQASVPITRSGMDKEKVIPIVDYIINMINKVANNTLLLKVNNIYNIVKEETDMEARLLLDIDTSYIVNVNDSFYIKSKDKVYGTMKKIDDVIIRLVVISRKDMIDDIFRQRVTQDSFYVSELYINGKSTDDFLPGSNIVKPLTHELLKDQEFIFTNKDIDELIRDKKRTHMQEMEGRTAQLETAPKLTRNFDEYVIGTK